MRRTRCARGKCNGLCSVRAAGMNWLNRDVKVGCCGFPEAREEYCKEFSAAEVQQTFYQPPLLKTALKWRKEAPASFEFTIKACGKIT